MLKPYFKSLFSDRILYPIRRQIAEHVPENSRVLDIGCGTGSLLRLLSPKIKEGTGIDSSIEIIKFAQKRARKLKLDNLDFKAVDFFDFSFSECYDAAVLSLFLHQFEGGERCEILIRASQIADKLIISDFSSEAGSSFLVKIDEVLARHYRQFADYTREGMEGSICRAGLVIAGYYKTKNKAIDLWVCKKYE